MQKKPKIYLFFALLLFLVSLPIVYLWFRNRDIIFDYYIFILPSLALFSIIAYFAIFQLNVLYFSVVFLVPLSIQLSNYFPESPIDMFIPTEPIIVGIMLLYYLRVLFDSSLDSRLLKHPLTLVILINILWLFLTSVSSTMPLVSFKYVLVRIWFVTVFYMLSVEIFKNRQNFKLFLVLYSVALLIVIIYSTNRLIHVGFWNKNASNGICNPFYKDHTSYGAALAIYFIMIAGLTLFGFFKKHIWLLIVLSVVLLFGLIFSYARAAWISVIGALFLVPFFIFNFRFRTFMITMGIIALVIAIISSTVTQQLKYNKQESSTSLAQHVQSITNISTDASNLERINRWHSAIEMFKQKPVLGWGPGAYMFQYAPFQIYQDKTIISTNFGSNGNAHSEYLGPLSEAGVFGMVSYILIIIFSFYTGFRVFHKANDRHDRILAAIILMSLSTYYIHGIMNNFLDTDKISCPFWGLTAMLVVLDLYGVKKLTPEDSIKNALEN